VSQAGSIEQGSILQAKGHHYTALELLAGNKALAEHFDGGGFATIYLSPKDYHRVHMPLAGRLTDMEFVPGDLYSVSDGTTQLIPRLFARNERVICHFEADFGPFAVVLVGAIFVGSIETPWHGEVHGPRHETTRWSYHGDDSLHLAKGAEMGRFNMGSTVILLLPPGVAEWQGALQAGQALRLGQVIGRLAGR
jgi:phosphatidylserine decarboxylase